MSGNGFYDSTGGVYAPKSVETWDDYDASSASVDWDGYTEWQATPLLPLTFTTNVIDYGSVEYINYLVNVNASNPVDLTVNYSQTVDSAGELVSPSTINVSPSTASLTAGYGRYWQVTVSCDRDSASLPIPTISAITTSLSTTKTQTILQDVDSSTLSGTTGVRSLPTLETIGTVSSIVTQAHASTSEAYVANDYVASGYFEAATFKLPVILADKTTLPIVLNIYDANASNAIADCVFDAVIQGLPKLSSDANGNTVEAT